MVYRFVPPRFDSEPPPLPAGLNLVADVKTFEALDRAACHALADVVHEAHHAGLSWPSRTRYVDPTIWNVDDQFRRSKNLSPKLQGLQLGYDALQSVAMENSAAFGVDASQARLQPVDQQCLVYHEGDRIGDHADDSAQSPADDGGSPIYTVIKPERHVVGILWLTTQTANGCGPYEFAGGTFRFNSLIDSATGRPLDIAPRAGLLVVFPANPWFRHEVLPVLAGTRIAITRWWSVVPVESPAASPVGADALV